jgi:hypothetical protein
LGRTWQEGIRIVLMIAGASSWISMHGELWKVATENLRKASNEERQGAEIVEKMPGYLSDAIHRRKRNRSYRDLTADPVIESEEEPEEHDLAGAPTPLQQVPSTPDETPPATRPDTPVRGRVNAEETRQGRQDRSRSRGRDEEEPTEEAPRNVRSSTSSSSQSQMPFGINPVAIPPSLEPEEKRARLFYNEMTKSLREFECEDSDECFYLQDKTLDGESFAYHADSEQCFIVAKKKSDKLPRSKISDREWPQFVEAMRKEVPEVLKSMRVLSMEESQQVLATQSDRIIPSRFHFRWKPVDEDGKIVHQAKCRWILIGFKDPDVVELERSAPTPQAATINLTTNACACLRFKAYQGDIKSAFAQSKRIDRELYISQPPEGIPGLQPGQLLS